MDKKRAAKVAKVAGGLMGIASALTFAWGSKEVGAACAALAVALVVPAAMHLHR